jgi:hypothetical protein
MKVEASGKTEDIHVPRTKKRGVTAGSLRQVPAARNSTTIATVFSTELLCHSINIIPLLAGGSFPLVGWDKRGKFIKVYRVAFSVHNEHLLRMELYNVNICIYDYRVSLSVSRFCIFGFCLLQESRQYFFAGPINVLCLYNKKEDNFERIGCKVICDKKLHHICAFFL